MQKPEFVYENEKHKIFWDFKIQMNHPVQARRPDPIIMNKEKKM